MPLFKSLRSKSRKGSFTSTNTSAGGVTETGSIQSPPPSAAPAPAPDTSTTTNATPAAAPAPAPAPAPALRSNNTSTSLEKKKSKLFPSSSSISRRKQSHQSASHDHTAVGRPSLSTNISTSGQLFTNNDTSTGTSSPPLPASFETGPRPSELFASKASQWSNQKDTPLSSSASVQASNNEVLSSSSSSHFNQDSAKSDDLQNFLKARRQWVPTFVTEFKEEPEAKRVDKPDDIAFSSGPQTGTLMSLKDLDESHQRKQRLLGGTFQPTTGSDWLSSSTTSPSLMTSRPIASSSASPPPPPPPPSSAARAIALTSIPASTVTGGPVIHAGSGSENSSRKSASISRKPAPSLLNEDTNSRVNGHTNNGANGSANGQVQEEKPSASAGAGAVESVPPVPVSPPPAAAAPIPTAPGQQPDTVTEPVAAPEPVAVPVAVPVAAPVAAPSATSSPPVTTTEASDVASQVTQVALHSTPSATTGGFVDASPQPPGAIATPQPPGALNGNITTSVPADSPRYNPARESMETSGGMFQTPTGSAPPSEIGHGGQIATGEGTTEGDVTIDAMNDVVEKKVGLEYGMG
ncbi:unnamed protein product [Sympodiomycopsis kandeliae]